MGQRLLTGLAGSALLLQPSQCAGGKRKDILTTGGIEGGNQNDWMSGGQGDNDLFGDDGNDTLKTRDHVPRTMRRTAVPRGQVRDRRLRHRE